MLDMPNDIKYWRRNIFWHYGDLSAGSWTRSCKSKMLYTSDMISKLYYFIMSPGLDALCDSIHILTLCVPRLQKTKYKSRFLCNCSLSYKTSLVHLLSQKTCFVQLSVIVEENMLCAIIRHCTKKNCAVICYHTEYALCIIMLS